MDPNGQTYYLAIYGWHSTSHTVCSASGTFIDAIIEEKRLQMTHRELFFWRICEQTLWVF